MNITSVTNPVYSLANNLAIDCMITCELGTIPFTATANDTQSYGATLFNELVAGNYGPIAPYQAPTLSWQDYQAQAQALLNKSDLVYIRCGKAGIAFPSNWLTYVQALRAIVSATTGDPTQPLPTTPAYPLGT